MPGRRRLWVLFGIISCVTAFVYWWHADWWAYVEFPEGPMPKFLMPWWWQVLVSGIVGCTAGGVVVLIWMGVTRLDSTLRLSHRSERSSAGSRAGNSPPEEAESS